MTILERKNRYYKVIHPPDKSSQSVMNAFATLSNLRVPVQTQGLLIAMTTGFSGFSILSQNALFLKDNGITFSHLVILAILRSIFSVCLMALILNSF